MAKSNSKSKRKLVGLVSEDGKTRIYYTKKNPQNTPDKLTLRKYNPKTRQHETFAEVKKNLGRNVVPTKHYN